MHSRHQPPNTHSGDGTMPCSTEPCAASLAPPRLTLSEKLPSSSLSSVAALELSVLLFLQQHSCPLFDALSLTLRRLVTDEGIFLLNLLLIWLSGSPTAGIRVAAIMGLGECLNAILKWAVRKPRPFWTSKLLRNSSEGFESDFSFPSSHAQTVATFATCMVMEFQLGWSAGVLLLLLTIASGVARIYLAVHWPSDVICGWVIGWIFTNFMQCVNFMEWFAFAEQNERLILAALLPISFNSALWLVQRCFPQISKAQVAVWEHQAWRNSPSALQSGKRIHVHDYTRYTFNVWSLVGGAIATNFAMQDLTLRFFVEDCTHTEIVPQVTRLIVGITGVALIFVPLVFVIPPLIFAPALARKGSSAQVHCIPPTMLTPATDTSAGFVSETSLPTGSPFDHSWRAWFSFILKALGICAFEVWVIYWSPQLSQSIFSAYCPIASLPHMDASFYLRESRSMSTLQFSTPSTQIDWMKIAEQPVLQDGLQPHTCNMDYYPGHRASALSHLERSRGQTINVVHNLEQLQQQVRNALKSGLKLRVVAMSLSPQLQPETLQSHLDTTVRFITLHNSTAFSGYRMQIDEKGVKWVTVGAGIQLGQTSEPDMKSTHHLGERLWADGLAIPSFTGVTAPSLGGVLLVGGDGGSVRYSMHDMVWGIRWIDGLGRLREAWRNDTTSSDFDVVSVSMGLAGIIYEYILQPEPAFCIRRTHGAETIDMLKSAKNPWSHTPTISRRSLSLVESIRHAEYGRVMFIPFSRPIQGNALRSHSARSVFLTTHTRQWRSPARFLENGAAPTCEPVFDSEPYDTEKHEFVSEQSSMMLAIFSRFTAQVACFNRTMRQTPLYWSDFLRKPLLQDIVRFTSAVRASNSSSEVLKQKTEQAMELCFSRLAQSVWDEKVGGVSPHMQDQLETYLACVSVRMGFAGAAAAAGGAVGDDGRPASPFHVGPSHMLLPMDASAPIHAHPLDFSELFIAIDPASRTQNVLYVMSAVERLFVSNEGLLGGALQIEVYWSKASRSWLSPAFSVTAETQFLRINAFQNRIRHSGHALRDDYQYYFAEVWRALHDAGIKFTAHFGKHIPSRVQHTHFLCSIRAAMPRLNQWREKIEQMDPHGLFRNDYWNRILFMQLTECNRDGKQG